jgi:hypothetical protein
MIKKVVFCSILTALLAVVFPAGGISATPPPPPVTDLSAVIAYPNPYNTAVTKAKAVTFGNLTKGGIRLRIFKLTGELIYDTQGDSSAGKVLWSLIDENSDPVASGLYLYVISNDAGQKAKGKIAVIK